MKVPDKQDIILEVTAKTNTGMQREANEDNFVVTPDGKSPEWILPKGEYPNSEGGTVLVVADGMGGLNAGEVASKIAVNSIKNFFTSLDNTKDKDIKQILNDAILNANSDIVKHGKDFPETSGMGSTIVMTVIKGANLHLAWVGDSRCYLLRNNELVQLSKDHSYVQTLVDQGKLTKEQAFIHPESNIITQSLGDDNRKPKPGYANFPLADKDIILLCSDGLNSMLRDDDIAQIIKENTELPQIAEKLIDGANNEGGHDNITVVMSRVVSGAGQTTAPVSDDKKDKTIDELNQPKKKSKYSLWYALLVLLVVAAIAVFAAKYFKKPVSVAPKPKTDTTTNVTKSKDSTNKQKVKLAAPVGQSTKHDTSKDTVGKGKKGKPKTKITNAPPTVDPAKGNNDKKGGSGLTLVHDTTHKTVQKKADSTKKSDNKPAQN